MVSGLVIQICFRYLMAILTHVKPLSYRFLNAFKSLPFHGFAGLVLSDLREVVLGHFWRECGMVESAVLVLPVVAVIMVHQLLP